MKEMRQEEQIMDEKHDQLLATVKEARQNTAQKLKQMEQERKVRWKDLEEGRKGKEKATRERLDGIKDLLRAVLTQKVPKADRKEGAAQHPP